MRFKIIERILAFVILLPFLLLSVNMHSATAVSASEPAPDTYDFIRLLSPDHPRIPSVISLLADTPMFDNPTTLDESQAIGMLSPQEGVQVLGSEHGWARGRSWWKISTLFGPKWISPEPWNVDVPPPDRITLTVETPLYATQDDTTEPTAVLTPQEVKVTGAQKQWFYSNDPSEKRWIRIQTSWLGQQWVHLPVSRVGHVSPVDRYEYYAMQYLLPDPSDNGPLYSMAGPRFKSLVNETVHITGEYKNVYDTWYQVETPDGPRYVWEKGIPVTRQTETVTLKSETPLLANPQNYNQQVLVLPPQTVTAFEKVTGTTMYHIQTELGDAWVDPSYSEPTNTMKSDVKLELLQPQLLYRFPHQRFELTGFTLRAGTVQPTAVWTSPEGATWYLLESNAGKVWFTVQQDQYRIIK